MIDNENSRIVIGEGGWRGRLDVTPTDEPDYVIVHPEDDGPALRLPLSLLEQHGSGTFHLPLTRSAVARYANTGDGEQIVVPVIEEVIEVSKRMVETGDVRIVKTVHEREEIVDEPLRIETVQVTRVPIDRAVDASVAPHEEGNTIIIPIYEERLVVRKQLFLKEEIHVTRQQTADGHTPQTVTLRREEVAIERQSTGVSTNAHPVTSDAV